jgi:hypothetical protein
VFGVLTAIGPVPLLDPGGIGAPGVSAETISLVKVISRLPDVVAPAGRLEAVTLIEVDQLLLRFTSRSSVPPVVVKQAGRAVQHSQRTFTPRCPVLDHKLPDQSRCGGYQ